MIHTLYIEEEVADHPRVQDVCARYPSATRIECGRYGEVFNRKAQNFRLQKQRPALLLARKFDGFVLETPAGYGVGGRRNYYFSHMLNCVYDCRYCFLQGMYRSAHHVLFVNYEDFQDAIAATLDAAPGEETWFFSGYDCDSLALEPVTGFAAAFLPFFREHGNARIELRTKSVQIRSLLEITPLANCVVAFSMTPAPTAVALEHKAPAVDKRLEAMVRLQEHGWQVGLRFDPLIYQEDFREQYRQLFSTVFTRLSLDTLHSVSIGPFRLPRPFRRAIEKLYPDEPLFAGPLDDTRGKVSYREDVQRDLVDFCSRELLGYIPADIFFPCFEGEP